MLIIVNEAKKKDSEDWKIHQFSSSSLDDVFNLEKKSNMIFITLEYFPTISHMHTTYIIYWMTVQSSLTFASSVGGLVELGGLY